METVIETVLFTDQIASLDLKSDYAWWHVDINLDADGHLNIVIRDDQGGSIQNIREESNITSSYEELLLRYTSDSVENNFEENLEEDEEEVDDDNVDENGYHYGVTEFGQEERWTIIDGVMHVDVLTPDGWESKED